MTAGSARKRHRARGTWRLTALGIVFGSIVCVPDAGAQFNARGRAHPPAKAPSAGKKARPPANSKPRTPHPASGTPSAGPTSPDSPGPHSPSSAEDSRKEVLIERYSGLILSQPGEEVPIKRLAQLLRERDGSLQPFLEKLRKDGAAAEDKYPFWIAEAGLLAEDAQTHEAVERLELATGKSPDRVEGWLLLSRLQLQLDQKAAARQSLEKALPLVKGPVLAITVRTLRDLCLDLGDFDVAKKYHARLLKASAGNVFLQGELGRELLRRGQTEKAIEELKGVVENSRGDARAMAPAWRDLGGAYLSAERFDDAISALTKASKLAVGQPGLRREIDEQLAQAHRGRGSLPKFLETLKDSATSAERLEILGRLYEEEGRPDDAAKAYERALGVAPRNVDVRLRLVRLFELTGNLEGATSQLESLAKSSPQDVHLGVRRMELLLAQGRRQEALRLWDRLETMASQDAEAGLLLVDFAERLGEPERGRKLMDRLAGRPQSDPRYLVELGSRFYRDGKEDQARKIWNRIVALRPGESAGHVTLGEVLIDHEAVEDGVKELQKAVELDPQSTRNRRALALGLERAGTVVRKNDKQNYEDLAIEEWEALLRLDDDPSGAKPMARRRIVRIEKRRGTLGARIAHLEQHLRGHPTDAEMAHLLTEGYLTAQNYPKAISTAQRLLQHQKGDRQALLQLERAYEGAGNHAQVIATLEQLVAVDPTRAREYYDRMADAATKQRDFAGALKFAELSVKRNPTDPGANAQLGELYLNQARTLDAEKAFRRALQLDDRQHQVALTLAELLAQTKRSDEALPLLFHVVRTARDAALIQRAARRALSMAVPVGKTEALEDVLRPLALGRTDQPVYRNLLLETLAAQYYPLHQAVHFGSEEAKKQALGELQELAERSTQPLLSALAGEDPESIQIAIDLLAYGDTRAAGHALITFAEGAAEDHLRLRAILAAGRSPREDLSRRLEPFVFEDGAIRRGVLAVGAVWVLARQRDAEAVQLLHRVLEAGSPSMRAYAAWGLADHPHLSKAQSLDAEKALTQLIQTNSAGDMARAAAALALGNLQAATGALPPAARHRALMHLQASSSDRSAILARSSLLALATFGDDPATQKLVAHSLFQSEATVRQAASVAAIGLVSELPHPPLLPERLDPAELDATIHLTRSLALREARAFPRESRFSALIHIAPALAEEIELSMRTSPASARTVLEQFRSESGAPALGSLLTPSDRNASHKDLAAVDAAWRQIREALRPELMLLAENTEHPLSALGLEQLRTTDGPLAEELLGRALASDSDATFQAALLALSHDGSARAVALLSHASETESWGRRRRRALSLGQVLYKEGSAEEAARESLERMSRDPSPLVRKAALEALRPAEHDRRPNSSKAHSLP